MVQFRKKTKILQHHSYFKVLAQPGSNLLVSNMILQYVWKGWLNILTWRCLLSGKSRKKWGLRSFHWPTTPHSIITSILHLAVALHNTPIYLSDELACVCAAFSSQPHKSADSPTLPIAHFVLRRIIVSVQPLKSADYNLFKNMTLIYLLISYYFYEKSSLSKKYANTKSSICACKQAY